MAEYLSGIDILDRQVALKEIKRLNDELAALRDKNEALRERVVRLGSVVDRALNEHMNQAIRNGTSGCICVWCLDARHALLEPAKEASRER